MEALQEFFCYLNANGRRLLGCSPDAAAGGVGLISLLLDAASPFFAIRSGAHADALLIVAPLTHIGAQVVRGQRNVHI